MNILDIAPERFSAIYNSLDPVEQETLTQILQEFSEAGESETYNTVWLQDYEEVPVDIHTTLFGYRTMRKFRVTSIHFLKVMSIWARLLTMVHKSTHFGGTLLGRFFPTVTLLTMKLC